MILGNNVVHSDYQMGHWGSNSDAFHAKWGENQAEVLGQEQEGGQETVWGSAILPSRQPSEVGATVLFH